MNRLLRYLYTLYGMVCAGWYILSRYTSRYQILTQYAQEALQNSDVPDRIQRRFRKYVPVFLLIEYFYPLIAGVALSRKQQHNATLLCGATPLFDDLIDEYGYDAQRISDLLAGRTVTPEAEARCAVFFLEKARATGEDWTLHWSEIIDIQLKSMHQKNSITDQEQLLYLTREKGGASVVFGWKAITGNTDEQPVLHAAYTLGAYTQLLSDIFDLWQDYTDGVETLATTTRNITSLSEHHERLFNDLTRALCGLSVSRHRFRTIYALLVTAFTMGQVALSQLRKLQGDGEFDVSQYSRKQLVCDMALWRNRLLWGWFTLIFYRKTV